MILTITGSDSTGGSGVQADIRTIAELGGYAVSAITSITVQNTLGIQEFFDIPAEIVSGQIEAAALFCRRGTQEGERHHSPEFQTTEPCREAGTAGLQA